MRARLAFVWGGGLAFVASLGWFAWFYYTTLGRQSAPRNSLVSHVTFDLVLFGAFATHHSIFARERVKRFVTRWVAPSLERSTYVWVASVLFILVCVGWKPVPGGELYRLTGWAGWLIRSLQFLGVLLIARAASVLDPLELAGIRQALDRVRPAYISARGPYRYIRHPLYTGWMIFVFGDPVMTVDRLTFAVISSAYLLVAIPWEEGSLTASLGEPYRAYRRLVKWRIVPFVY